MVASAPELPPELIAAILEHIWDGREDLAIGLDPETAEALRRERVKALKTCSLVCMYWATMVRPGIWFQGVLLRRVAELKLLEQYVVQRKNERIMPMSELISQYAIEQDWNSRSWCHEWYSTGPRLKPSWNYFRPDVSVSLQGPLPEHLPVFALHSPHWSLPRSMPSCFFAFIILELCDIRFPSLLSFTKLMRHFKHTKILIMSDIDIDHLDENVPSHAPLVKLWQVRAYNTTEVPHNVALAYKQVLRALRPSSLSASMPQHEWDAWLGLAWEGRTLDAAQDNVKMYDRLEFQCVCRHSTVTPYVDS